MCGVVVMDNSEGTEAPWVSGAVLRREMVVAGRGRVDVAWEDRWRIWEVYTNNMQ